MHPPMEQKKTSILQALTIGRSPRRTLVRVIVLVVVVYLVFKFALVPTRIQGISMNPTYHQGQIKFVNRLAYKFGGPQRGDIVALKIAGERVLYMKRIIALPGEEFSIRNGTVYIDGGPLDEPYLNPKVAPWNETRRKIPEGEYLVIGDNRSMGQRDHEWGVFSRERIVGKAVR